MTKHAVRPPSSALSLYSRRPFFEKALLFGIEHGIIDRQKLDAMASEAPKGMVQIARYFGNEFLRADLEKAKDRLINLVSLDLEHASNGDLGLAAKSLREHSLLSRSKAGSDMLRNLLAMPQDSHFGMGRRKGFGVEQIGQLAKWSLCSLADYQSEYTKRSQVEQTVDAAIWLAGSLGLESAELEDEAKDAEAVIRTALLRRATRGRDMPDWVAFEKMVLALRKKRATGEAGTGMDAVPAFAIRLPRDLPARLVPVVEALRQSVVQDLPRILDLRLEPHKLFNQTPSFIGRYFWIDNGLNEIDHHERAVSAAWDKVTGGHRDDGSLLTLFLCIAAQAKPRTLLNAKSASTLIRKIRTSGLHPGLSRQYIERHAPAPYRQDYARMWDDFIEEAGPTLLGDDGLNEALSLLRQECNVLN